MLPPDEQLNNNGNGKESWASWQRIVLADIERNTKAIKDLEDKHTAFVLEISKAVLTQAHIAETEKYGHVTFFFNGGRSSVLCRVSNHSDHRPIHAFRLLRKRRSN